MERLGRERVVLLLGEPVRGLVHTEVDAERVELGSVRVETSREGILGHVRVALHVAPDLRGRHRPPLRHQIGDQRQLADELFRVLRQTAPHLRVTREDLCWVPALFARFRMSLRLVLIEDHQALREGLELLLDRAGIEVVGTAGTAQRGAGADRTPRAGRRAGRHPARRGVRHRPHRAAPRRRPRAARRALHRLERDRAADQRAGLRRARLRAQGRHAGRAHVRAADRRRRRHVRGPAPAPGPALSAQHAEAEGRSPSASARSWTCSRRA